MFPNDGREQLKWLSMQYSILNNERAIIYRKSNKEHILHHKLYSCKYSINGIWKHGDTSGTEYVSQAKSNLLEKTNSTENS